MLGHCWTFLFSTNNHFFQIDHAKPKVKLPCNLFLTTSGQPYCRKVWVQCNLDQPLFKMVIMKLCMVIMFNIVEDEHVFSNLSFVKSIGTNWLLIWNIWFARIFKTFILWRTSFFIWQSTIGMMSMNSIVWHHRTSMVFSNVYLYIILFEDFHFELTLVFVWVVKGIWWTLNGHFLFLKFYSQAYICYPWLSIVVKLLKKIQAHFNIDFCILPNMALVACRAWLVVGRILVGLGIKSPSSHHSPWFLCLSIDYNLCCLFLCGIDLNMGIIYKHGALVISWT